MMDKLFLNFLKDHRDIKVNLHVFDFLHGMQTYRGYYEIPDGIIAWMIMECFGCGSTAKFQNEFIFTDGTYGYTENGPVTTFTEQKVCLQNYMTHSPECDDWIRDLLREHENANQDALRLIYSLSHSDAMRRFFSSGYCYYLARMLQELTGEGTVCWHRSHGHILWVDQYGYPYDIYGFFKDYNGGDMVDVSVLGDIINDMKHDTGYVYRAPEPFHAWAQSLGVSDLEALSLSYMEMKSYDDKKTVEEQVMCFWPEHREKCEQRIRTWLLGRCQQGGCL